MRLYLAVAVLMLAFAAYAEAQDQEQELTMEQRFTQFRDQIEAMTGTFSEKARSFFEGLHNSDFATDARNRLQQYIQTVREKFTPDKSQ